MSDTATAEKPAKKADPRDAEIAALKEQLAALQKPEPAASPTEPATLHKLYFNRDPLRGDPKKPNTQEGNWHVCGRSSPPTRFEPSDTDKRAHAFVTRAFGDHLIDVEQRTDGSPRYEWAKD